jgi:hypothetical protein
MNGNKTFTIAAAALTGLLAGSAGRAMAATAPVSHQQTSVQEFAGQMATSLADQPTSKHACKGMNDCKGQGGCKSSDNGCKGKNSCKGKGGCSTEGTTPAPKPGLF